MNIDPANQLTITTLLHPSTNATNNSASDAFDLKDYIGRMAVRVSIGAKTAGDADGEITVKLQESEDNTAANAVDINGVFVYTNNANTTSATLSIDTRERKRFLFARRIISGTNSPSYPVAVEVIGTKQTQP